MRVLGVMREKVCPSHSFDARSILVSDVGTAISRPRDALSVPQNSRANPHRVRLFPPPLCKGRCRRRSPARQRRRGCRPSAGPKLRPRRRGASRCTRRPASTQNRGPFVNGPYAGTSVPSVGVGVLDDPALLRSPPRPPRANPHRVRLFPPPLCKGRCPSAHTGAEGLSPCFTQPLANPHLRALVIPSEVAGSSGLSTHSLPKKDRRIRFSANSSIFFFTFHSRPARGSRFSSAAPP